MRRACFTKFVFADAALLKVFAGIAQLVERYLAKVEVTSSSLVARSKTFSLDAGIAQLVERYLAKVEVTSSSLVARSKSQIVSDCMRA